MRCFWQSISWPAQMIKLRIAPTSTATSVCQYPRLIYEAAAMASRRLILASRMGADGTWASHARCGSSSASDNGVTSNKKLPFWEDMSRWFADRQRGRNPIGASIAFWACRHRCRRRRVGRRSGAACRRARASPPARRSWFRIVAYKNRLIIARSYNQPIVQ